MASRQYAQFHDAAYAGQSAADVMSWPSAPAVIRGAEAGKFRVSYLPSVESGTLSDEVFLLSMSGSAGVEVSINPGDGVHAFVRVAGVEAAQSAALTFSAMQEITVEIEPSTGTLTVVGATTGNGSVVGTPWSSVADATFYLGSDQGVSGFADGYVSLPYSVVP